MISKFSASLTLHKIASCTNLILIPWVSDALPTPWDNITKTCVASYSWKPNTLELWVLASLCCHYTHRQYYGPRCFLWIKITFSQLRWYHIFWMHKANRHYSLHTLQILFPGLLLCAILHVSQVQIGICLGNLEFYHVYRCQQAWAHSAEVCVLLFLSFFPSFLP
jgi:hypothetical protein